MAQSIKKKINHEPKTDMNKCLNKFLDGREQTTLSHVELQVIYNTSLQEGRK